MKVWLTILTILFKMNLLGQVYYDNRIQEDDSVWEYLDEMGIDTSEYLNDYELEYFLKLFKDVDVNLKDKKISFLEYCGKRSNKLEYFNFVKEYHTEYSSTVSTELYLFDVHQKKESGGYDAVIVYWCKRKMGIGDVVKKVKEK